MARARTQLPGSGSTSQQAAGNEEEMRRAAMQAAMMNDLGIARVAELPLDDGHGDRDRRNRGPGVSNRNRPAPLPTPSASSRPRQNGSTGAGGSGAGDLWRQAYAAGAFDDEDAAAVRGLDDLGGGRIYERVINHTMQILSHHNRRSNRRSTEQPSANGRVHLHELPRRIGQSILQSRQQNTSGTQTSAARALVPSASSRAPPRELNPMARPARVPRQPVPAATPPAPAPPSLAPASNPTVSEPAVAGPSSGTVVPNPNLSLPDPNVPLPFEEPFEVLNVVYERSIRFSSRHLRQPVSAIVLLSAAGPPANGGFTVVIYNRRFCQWPISGWYDYTTGEDMLLGVLFKDVNGSMHGYELHFDFEEHLRDFMATARRLQSGEISPPVGYTYVSKRSATVPSQPAPAAPPPAPATVPPHPTPAAPRPAPATNPTGSQAAVASLSNAAAAGPSNAVGTQPTRESDQPRARLPSNRTARGPTSESNQVETQASSSANTINTAPVVVAAGTRASTVGSIHGDSLAENEADDVNFVDNQSPTVSSGSLPALAPRKYSNGTGDGTPLAQIPFAEVSIAVRGLFHYFLSNTNLVPTWTAETKNEMASAIKAGVLDYIAQEARCQGLGDQQVHGLEQLIDGVLASLTKDHQDGPDHEDGPDQQNAADHQDEADHQDRASRIRYKIEELMSMRHRPIDPPGFLADIPYLPKPGSGKRQVSSSSQSQVQRSVDAMAWVQGEAATPALDTEETLKAEPEEAAAAVATVARPGGTRVTGLRGSRWATGESEIRHANHFTGPAYEKVPPGHGHQEDLAQVDPQSQVPTASADLTGLDFRTSDNDMDGARSAGSQAAADHISQAAALTNSTHTTTDKIENLGFSLSRLTIRSPTKAQTKLVKTSVAQSPDRVSVPSPGPAAPTAFRPAAPVFTPGPTLPSGPSVSLAPVVAPQLTALVPGQPLAAPATQAKPRGLLASRHAAGSGPSSSGNFNYHLPSAVRKELPSYLLGADSGSDVYLLT
ncbi:hypothetical protein C8A03DRAFT_30826 [Achaetomium macrosporum]|uniref:Uncharacterized protein n=1 Tax=Achaetomium macrosporum TaxID=79813 RepID=A0AAN7CF85_9PEZI|nr:hypothetical protein C8A03DRAFT_30826 [Achaetomium macrosporum]